MGFVKRKQTVWILLLGFVTTCIVSKKEDDTLNQQLIGWILTSNSNPACFDYYSQENLCLKSPKSISEKCSDQEMDRFQNGIQPANLQKREILEELLRCWSKCNSTFFLSHPSGSSCSFETESDYVTAKRSGSTNSGNLWRQCQSNCNTGTDSSFPKLKGISTTNVYWPYP
ncbi:hypothetical protein [Leptospira alstonii]|uniref:Uncharacterized protein n=2 Tax=Leptospira alstonii TaxID=28452 RepID=M6CIX9_9LEPT|nr:hypothetical protein [Leptospira alstonii]EMJ91699.1 hypothetical protein LEP1GSC194_4099 [Leptospira alstonii serovar Sichuan str. 79601]EQA79606.1 hypothetical protein LEP1GSC193_3042 [Leptospira alstonii serovar Pingchang str. 80-412]